MSNKTPFSTITIVFLIIGVIVGAGGGYYMMRARVADLTSEISSLTESYSQIQVNYTKLETQISLLENQVSSLESQVTGLENEKSVLESHIFNLETELSDAKTMLAKTTQTLFDANERYTALLNTLNMTIIMNFTQSIEFNVTAGTGKTWEFLIPNYGIIWEAKISFSGTYVSMSHAWRRGAERVFVGSSGISLIYKGSADIVYYGIQDHLWGTISVDYYLDERNPNKIWVTSNIITNLPTISRSGSAYIDV